MALKVIVAGTRKFDDYELVKNSLDSLPGITEIVSGGAAGADSLGERYAQENGIPVAKFPAMWSEYGKAAGPIRNKEMAEYGDVLVAFWDGESPGTKSMIYEMKLRGKQHITILYENENV